MVAKIYFHKAWHVTKRKSSLNFADELFPRTKRGNFCFFFKIKVIPSWYPPGITNFLNKMQPSFTCSKALGGGRVLQEQGPLKALFIVTPFPLGPYVPLNATLGHLGNRKSSKFTKMAMGIAVCIINRS